MFSVYLLMFVMSPLEIFNLVSYPLVLWAQNPNDTPIGLQYTSCLEVTIINLIIFLVSVSIFILAIGDCVWRRVVLAFGYCGGGWMWKWELELNIIVGTRFGFILVYITFCTFYLKSIVLFWLLLIVITFRQLYLSYLVIM